MADYNRQNFNNMKREAVRTAKEMQKRTAVNNNNLIPEVEKVHIENISENNVADNTEKINIDNTETDDKNTDKTNDTQNSSQKSDEDKKKNESGGLFGLAGGILENLGIKGKLDNDKIIIIIMIIILAREGADLKLLIALGYILM